MRKDMSKVVIDTARHGGRGLIYRPNRPGEDYENYHLIESMKWRWRDRKEQSDRLKPLWGYLHKHVGKPWNDVWSDICEHMDFRSVLGFHIRSHIDQYVHKRPHMIDGVPHEIGYGGPWREIVYGLYVDPADGLLKQCREVSYRSAPKPVSYKVIDDHTQLHWLHGGWFLIKIVRNQGVRLSPDVAGTAPGKEYETYGRNVYAISKRQISRKEKKAWGLP